MNSRAECSQLAVSTPANAMQILGNTSPKRNPEEGPPHHRPFPDHVCEWKQRTCAAYLVEAFSVCMWREPEVVWKGYVRIIEMGVVAEHVLVD